MAPKTATACPPKLEDYPPGSWFATIVMLTLMLTSWVVTWIVQCLFKYTVGLTMSKQRCQLYTGCDRARALWGRVGRGENDGRGKCRARARARALPPSLSDALTRFLSRSLSRARARAATSSAGARAS